MQHRLHLTRIGTLQSEIREQHDHVLARVRPTPLHDRAFAAAQATKRSAGLSETTPLTSSFRPSRDSGESRNDQSEFSRRPRGAQRARRAVKNASGDAGRYSRSFGLSASLASPPCGEWKAYRVTAAIARNSIQAHGTCSISVARSRMAPRAGFEPATNRLTEFSAATTLHYAASTCTAQAIVNPQHIGQNTIRVIAGYCT